MNKNEIRIGDVLYAPHIMLNQVVEHKIVDIYMKKYFSGWRTVITTDSCFGKKDMYATDVHFWCLTREGAEEALKKSYSAHHALKSILRRNGLQ